jgi:hypothetical protein
MSWDDNPYLSKNEIAYLESMLPPDALERRKYGRFVGGNGLIFSEFGDENIVEPFNMSECKRFYISIDPGYKNPTAVLWLAVDDQDNIFVADDYEVAWKTIEEHSQAIKDKTKKLGWDMEDIHVLIDSAANQKTAACNRSTAEQYRSCGIAVDAKVGKNVLEGIIKMKGLFCSANNKRRLFVFKCCLNLIDELRGYFWKDDDKPQKNADHTIDALRYAIMEIERKVPPKLGILGEAKQTIMRRNLAAKNYY